MDTGYKSVSNQEFSCYTIFKVVSISEDDDNFEQCCDMAVWTTE